LLLMLALLGGIDEHGSEEVCETDLKQEVFAVENGIVQSTAT